MTRGCSSIAACFLSFIAILFIAPEARAHSSEPGRAGASATPVMGIPAEFEAVRAAHEKYRDVTLAVRDGYFSTAGCIQLPNGAMGVHFLNMSLVGPVPDPMKPPILLYAPNGDGTLELAGVEYFVPVMPEVKSRPSVFGYEFDGPMEGHYPLLPKELVHYDQHVWLYRENPAGLFAQSHPGVTCSGPYTFDDEVHWTAGE